MTKTIKIIIAALAASIMILAGVIAYKNNVIEKQEQTINEYVLKIAVQQDRLKWYDEQLKNLYYEQLSERRETR